MKIDRPQHPAGRERGASRRLPADGDNKYADFASQLAARAEKLRATPVSHAHAAAFGFDPEEPASRPLLSYLPAAARSRPVWAGAALLTVIAAVAIWLLSYPSPQPSTLRSVEPAKADVSSSPIKPVRMETNTSPASPPSPAKPAVPIAPPAAVVPPTSPPEVVKATPDLRSASPQVPATAQATAAPLTRDEIRELQDKLQAAGFNPGPIDGALGPLTRDALRKYAGARSMPSADPTKDMLARLRTEPAASR